MAGDPKPLSLFLCGDVMTGRGIDQVLPHPGDPTLYEDYVQDARIYVQLAERINGPIQRPVSFKYIWGDTLMELEWAKTDLRIINLETSITSDGEPWSDKGIHYRMHPENAGCFSAARITACSLANNHVLDWGYPGLSETIGTLDKIGLAHAGAGGNARAAAAPAIIETSDHQRVLFFAFGTASSGIPKEWRADMDQPGINLLDGLSQTSAARVADQIRKFQKPGDLMIASIHWGGNWGYEVPDEHIGFAHQLIEEGVALVHGHSSHHVKPIEIYKEHLILYGAGDFVNDYEGITGNERFRGDLALMYLIKITPQDGRVVSANLVPMQMRGFRLHRASEDDARWLCALLDRLGAPFDTGVQLAKDCNMTITGVERFL